MNYAIYFQKFVTLSPAIILIFETDLLITISKTK